MVRIEIVVIEALLGSPCRILGQIRGLAGREIDKADAVRIAALHAGVFGEGHDVRLTIVAALTGFTVSLHAAGGGAGITEEHLILLLELGHVVVGCDTEGRLTGDPWISATLVFNGGDGSG